jgi:L-seryl-tRNA(Ser) seleniumtransferase
LRAQPIPIIGRIEAGRVILDMRCLEDDAAFIAQLDGLVLNNGSASFETAALRPPQDEEFS